MVYFLSGLYLDLDTIDNNHLHLGKWAEYSRNNLGRGKRVFVQAELGDEVSNKKPSICVCLRLFHSPRVSEKEKRREAQHFIGKIAAGWHLQPRINLGRNNRHFPICKCVWNIWIFAHQKFFMAGGSKDSRTVRNRWNRRCCHCLPLGCWATGTESLRHFLQLLNSRHSSRTHC